MHLSDYLDHVSTRLITELATVFSTPLKTVKGSVTALMDSATGESREARSILLSEGLMAVEQLEDLVENLLSTNRLDSGILTTKKSNADILDLASVTANALRRQSGDHPPSVSIDGGVLLTFLDFNLMAQALTNVLLNVVMHTSPGTPVKLNVEREGRAIWITIADRGPGVLPEELSNLFGRFFRGKNAAKWGIGLGLPVCKGIVQGRGGSVSASNNPWGGPSISLFLPDCLTSEEQREVL
jgi:K+-sensing histidine kinase KdpD